MSRQFITLLSFLTLLFLPPRAASAIPPPFVSDRELAESPVVVVAKWTGAAWKDNSLVEGNVLKEHEVQTEIEVERVINGKVSLGSHKVLVGFRIGWSKEHPLVMSYMSTEVPGGATATGSNLWFLNKKKSRVDGKEYLHLYSYRAVQPLALEPYFKVLLSKQVADALPRLLSSSKEIVQIKTLELIAGGDLPWPYEPKRLIRPESDSNPIKGQSNAIRLLASKGKSKKVRRIAVAVCAKLEGSDSIPFMRELLGDKDAEVRAIAIGTLVAHRDLQSADLMPKAAVGLENPIVACELIARLRRWNDVKAVPVLIEFLEDDGLSYIIGNDLGIPAVKSQETIRKITGYALPFDVAVSRDAWSQAKDISNREERIQLLRRILPNDPDPWNAVLLRNEKKYVIEVTNRSKQTISLLKQPSYIDVSYSHGVFTVGHDKGAKTGKARFEKLAPGGSIRFPVDFRNQDFEFLISSGKRQRIELQYLENGNEFGLKAWLGVVEVSVAKNIASAKTPTKEVTERWPNGNLKLKGQTLGRVKTGEWTYFNEAGDRTRTIEYFNGRIAKEATYNPSHPTNDGMGKKPESPQAREAEASILGSSAIKRTVISLLALLSIVALMTGALWYRRRRTAA